MACAAQRNDRSDVAPEVAPAAAEAARRRAAVIDAAPTPGFALAASYAVLEGARSAPLDLHEDFSDPPRTGCQRWPEHQRLRSSSGELVRGRCGSTNQCDYCAKLGAVENSEMLALDALAGDAPQVWAVLTTAKESIDAADFYRPREQVLKALKRRWPDARYAALVEFTTGYGDRSGGKRRPHWNLLLKGVPFCGAEGVCSCSDHECAGPVIRRVWCARKETAAAPAAQFVGSIADAGGLMRYIALHFQKESQRPPEGWTGHRFIKSRDYFSRSTAAQRARAKHSLRHKREVWSAIRDGAQPGHEAQLVALQRMAWAEHTRWQLVKTHETSNAAEPPVWPRRTVKAPAIEGVCEAVAVQVSDFGVKNSAAPSGKFGAWRSPQADRRERRLKMSSPVPIKPG